MLLGCPLGKGQVKWVKDKRRSVSTVDGSVKIPGVDKSSVGEYTCSLGHLSYNYYVGIKSEWRLLGL